MEPILLFGAIGLGGAALIALIVYAIGADKRRSQALQDAAQGAGFRFEISADGLLAQGVGSMPLFNHGHSRRARNVLRPPSDEYTFMFDYRYTTGSGKHQQTHYFTVTALKAKAQPFPEFVLRPEGFFDKIGQAVFKSVDYDFPENPEFSKRYLLRGPDEARIRSFFDYAALDFFARERKWIIEANGPWLIVYKSYSWLKPAGLTAWYEDVRRVTSFFARS